MEHIESSQFELICGTQTWLTTDQGQLRTLFSPLKIVRTAVWKANSESRPTRWSVRQGKFDLKWRGNVNRKLLKKRRTTMLKGQRIAQFPHFHNLFWPFFTLKSTVIGHRGLCPVYLESFSSRNDSYRTCGSQNAVQELFRSTSLQKWTLTIQST